MAFQAFKKTGRPGYFGMRPARAAIKRFEAIGTRIEINPRLMTELGWAPGSRVSVAIGSGSDFGTIRIAQSGNSDGFTLFRLSKQQVPTVGMSCRSLLPGHPVPAATAPHMIKHEAEGAVLYLTVPPQFLAITETNRVAA